MKKKKELNPRDLLKPVSRKMEAKLLNDFNNAGNKLLLGIAGFADMQSKIKPDGVIKIFKII
jgi:hypothetical protein